ncbi:MAG: peptidoglycan-binding domain-containing protein [Pyrinomonadaceae bacterium]
MNRILTLTLSLLFVFSTVVAGQTSNPSTTGSNGARTSSKRGPVFRATKDQINQAQSILKGRGFYGGGQTGKLDDETRSGLRKYQEAEGLKVTGTLNKLTLEKMAIELTEKQKAM